MCAGFWIGDGNAVFFASKLPNCDSGLKVRSDPSPVVCIVSGAGDEGSAWFDVVPGVGNSGTEVVC